MGKHHSQNALHRLSPSPLHPAPQQFAFENSSQMRWHGPSDGARQRSHPRPGPHGGRKVGQRCPGKTHRHRICMCTIRSNKQRLLAIFCLWCADVEEAGTSSSTMTWRPVRAARCALTASRAPRSVWPFVASTVTTIGAACALAGGTARGAGDPNARVSVQTSARRSLRIPPPHCQRARALRMF